jgi:glycerol-3-phosphate acyltransferase PlsY
MQALLFAAGAYLIGSTPFAVIVSRVMGLEDPRSYGSGNPGATNVLRSGSKVAAVLTLLGDAAKGWFAVWLAEQLQAPADVVAVAAIAVFLGHVFSLWLRFKGGKGVATTLGVMWGLSWPVGAITCVAWLAIAAVFRYSSLAALLSTVIGAGAAWLMLDWRVALAITVLVPLVWVRHHENIARLLNGTESKIGRSTMGQQMGHNGGPRMEA